MEVRRLSVLAVAVLLLAGCTKAPSDVQEIVVESRATGGAEAAEAVAASGQAAHAGSAGLGDLTGVVVDPAIHPIEGATVRLPGMDLVRRTGSDGAFGFIDLVAGPYRLTVEAPGHRSLDALVDVDPGAVAQVRVVLQPDPSLQPYHQTHDYRGYAEVATDPTTSQFAGTCDACSFRVFLEEPAESLIIEGVRSADGGQPGQGFAMRWWVDVRDGEGQRLAAEYGPEPYYLHLDRQALENTTVLRVEMRPIGFPLPETSVDFEVYATAFHHEAAPAAWSFVRGDR